MARTIYAALAEYIIDEFKKEQGIDLSKDRQAAGEAAIVFRDVSQEETVHRLLGYFIANVAHEFRTPLSALAASAELLMDQAPDLTPAEMGELLRTLHLGVLGLQTLVDNLLESASIEAGHFRASPRASDLKKIIAEAAATMRPLLEKYNQRLVVETPPELPDVLADPRRTAQVLVNLLSNASKYGPADEQIELAVTLTGDRVRVAVADRGPGISGGKREAIFRRFEYPSAAEGPAKVGAGLGLSVVFGIVKEHGGDIRVTSQVGKGTTFSVFLPSFQGPMQAAPPAPMVKAQAGSERILLVDDEIELVSTLAERLELLVANFVVDTCFLAVLSSPEIAANG